MFAKYEDTESERKTDKAQTKGKLLRFPGQRGSMAHRGRCREPDGRKCRDWKSESGVEKEREWWENVIVGRKQKGLCMKRKTWTAALDKNSVFRRQNGTSWGWQIEDWMEDMKYHER